MFCVTELASMQAARGRLTWYGARGWQLGLLTGTESCVVGVLGTLAGWVIGLAGGAIAAWMAGAPVGTVASRSCSWLPRVSIVWAC